MKLRDETMDLVRHIQTTKGLLWTGFLARPVQFRLDHHARVRNKFKFIQVDSGKNGVLNFITVGDFLQYGCGGLKEGRPTKPEDTV